MTNPTNPDLAAALREIADTLPIGSALIVRLAADRLADTDGWIEWDPSAPGAEDGPDTGDAPLDVRAIGAEWINDGDDKSLYSWGEGGSPPIIAYRLSRP